MKTLPKILIIIAALIGSAHLQAVETRYATTNLITVAGGGFAHPDDTVSSARPIGFDFVFGCVTT